MAQRILAILLDCGDTLIDEATEIKDAAGITQHADLIPGAREMLEQLCARGYKIALVADGPTATFRNIFAQHDLSQFFAARAISEEVGNDKPHPSMFLRTLNQLGVTPQDYTRVVMVGNHLGRDVKGANNLGLISVWLDWSPRRAKVPADESEQPQHTIKTPLELIPLLDSIEKS